MPTSFLLPGGYPARRREQEVTCLTHSRPMLQEPPILSHAGVLLVSDGIATLRADSTDACSQQHSHMHKN